jgi:hypothetical protein
VNGGTATLLASGAIIPAIVLHSVGQLAADTYLAEVDREARAGITNLLATYKPQLEAAFGTDPTSLQSLSPSEIKERLSASV